MKVLVAVAAMVVALCSSAASAGPDQEKADALFKKGKALLGQQKFADACAAFEESQRLDPATGTVLNLALCYEGWGKLARAQRAYLEAEKMAAIKGDTQRSSAARQRADALTPRIPKIVFSGLPDPLPAGLTVTLDDQPVGLDALRPGLSTDPGPHVLVYKVEGARKVIRIDLAESQAKEVTLDLPAPRPQPDPGRVEDPRPKPPPVVKTRGRGRRILGLVTTGVGVVGMGIGGALALSARSDYKQAFDAHCDAMNTCDDIGFQETSDARSRANVASVIVGVGVGIAITGVVLYLTAPSGPARDDRAVWIRPVLTTGGGAVVVGGKL
jgi:tetratricopeptide (TPR) repeat protein